MRRDISVKRNQTEDSLLIFMLNSLIKFSLRTRYIQGTTMYQDKQVRHDLCHHRFLFKNEDEKSIKNIIF